jgi:tubulin polyglutamylase TTLL6/13
VDVSTINERFAKVEAWQRVNHFPGMSNISRKNRLAQNLGKMRRKFPVCLCGELVWVRL